MKIKLGKQNRQRQAAIRKLLAAGIPLAGLLASPLLLTGCGDSPAAPAGDAVQPSPENVPEDECPVPVIPPGVPVMPVGIMVPLDQTELQQETEIYSVKSGDTLLQIARDHHTTLNTLIRLNDFLPGQANHLKVGQQIKVPASPAD